MSGEEFPDQESVGPRLRGAGLLDGEPDIEMSILGDTAEEVGEEAELMGGPASSSGTP